MEYRMLTDGEIDRSLFATFQRRQVVDLCWRREGGGWVIRPDPFIDDWNESDYVFLIRCLQNTLRTGGAVFAALQEDALKGFASVEPQPFGSRRQYLDLSSLHVSAEMRGQGLGKRLFGMAAGWARKQGAEKLYISAHSAAETQAFYRAMGCRDAQEHNLAHVKQEPFDCQLEYVL